MSGKIKLRSSSSTPVKSKASDNSSVSPSPVKSSRYRNFLAAVLTPSQNKKWLKKKKSAKSEESFGESNTPVVGIFEDSQIADGFSEPGYSSIQELQIKYTEPVTDSKSLVSSKLSENIYEASDQHLCHQQQISINTNNEPLYSTVNKKKRNKITHADAAIKDNRSYEQSDEKTTSEYTLYEEAKTEIKESSNKKLIEEQKEEIKLLVERMKELTKENRELHRNIETIIKEEKWKEESLYATLKLKITQLEADTHKEVKCLSDQVTTLHEERKVLTEQIHVLHEENRLMKMKYEDASQKILSMISPESLKKVVNEHEKLLNQIKKKHLEEIKKLQQENKVLLESKITLIDEVEELKEKVQVLASKNETLRNAERELLQERNRMLLQLEESKQMQQEAENMLQSLLKIAETITVERDVLLNKSSFQDHQQKLLQSTMMDYSLNMGRLQEHISMLSKEKSEELRTLKSMEFQRDENLKNLYGKQLDLLHSKVLNQSNTINGLESEKSKLELQLESLWQAGGIGKSKREDANYDSETRFHY